MLLFGAFYYTSFASWSEWIRNVTSEWRGAFDEKGPWRNLIKNLIQAHRDGTSPNIVLQWARFSMKGDVCTTSATVTVYVWELECGCLTSCAKCLSTCRASWNQTLKLSQHTRTGGPLCCGHWALHDWEKSKQRLHSTKGFSQRRWRRLLKLLLKKWSLAPARSLFCKFDIISSAENSI